MIITNKHVFFFKDWLSNFTPCNFNMITINHGYKTFISSEQAFMFLKAETFKDEDSCQKILNSTTPAEAKQYGRQVKNYDDEIWDNMRFTCMVSCNYHKYSENQDLLIKLLDQQFDNKIFAEASPFDKIWGIALDSKKYPIEYIDDEKNWIGDNLMGKVINEVRQMLKDTNNGK